MNFVDVVAIDELPTATPMAAQAGGHDIVLVRLTDRVCALQRRCPHLGGDLAKGRLTGGILVCPRHAAAFEVATGAAVDPARLLFLKFKTKNALTYPVNVEGGRVLVGVEPQT